MSYITNQYNHQENALRNSLYKEFHALKLNIKRPVKGFNSAFNEFLNRLTVLRVIINPKDISNQYINTVEKVYPAWAERQRFALRQAMALGFSVKRLNLPYLQGDLATDNRVNKPYYNQGQSQSQNQGQGQGHSQSHSQGQSQGQRPKRPKKGKKKKSSSNSSGGSSNGPNNSESKYGTSNPSENQAYSFLIGSYLLELNNSSLEREFNSDSDSLVESNPFFYKNRANRLKKSGKTKGKKACKYHKFDVLLYDIKSSDYIINDRKWFVEFDSDKGKLPVFITGGGPVTPQGQGKALFKVKAKPNKGYYITLTL